MKMRNATGVFMLRLHTLLLFPLLFFVAIDVFAASAFSCGTRLVREGDTKVDVLRACGEPAWRERYTEEWRNKDKEAGIVFGGTVAHEEWVYNFGPTQFMRHLHFENSELVRIETGKYGFTPGSGDGHCAPRELEYIDTKAEALHRCGEPLFKDSRQEVRLIGRAGVKRRTTVTVDEWTYDFGPTQFMRTLIFENGELVDIREGKRGG